MYKRFSLLIFVTLTFVASLQAQAQTVIDPKGTRIVVDTSKWTLDGANIYNKNTGSVGIGTEGVANSDAALEVSSTGNNKGLLIPRLALSSSTSPSPLVSHRAGMIVYNTATVGDVTPGLYYNDGTGWRKAVNSNKADTTDDAWINDALNTQVKLGTRSNGTARLAGTDVVIRDNGYIGIGTNAPVAKLQVRNGDFRLENDDNWNAYKGVTYSNTRYPQLFLFKAKGTKASPSYPDAGNTLGVFRAANAIDSAGGGGFKVNAAGTQSGSAHGASVIVFTTESGTSDNKERFIVNDKGNVGIGTTGAGVSITPASKLDVDGYVKLGTSDVTANAWTTVSTRQGMIRYNSGSKTLQYHDDTKWRNLFGSASAADTTNDAWINDIANTQVSLGARSDGTARAAGTEVVIKDDARMGIGTATPSTNAILDLNSANKGIRITRVALTATNAAAPLSAHEAGMMVYNTATAGTAPNNVIPGFYYNNGTRWVNVADAASVDASSDAWVNDNANTQVKLGTLSDGTTARPDAANVVVKNDGKVGIGTTTPTSPLQVVGLPVFVDNAAAIAGGLTVGAFYHSGDGIVRTVYAP